MVKGVKHKATEVSRRIAAYIYDMVAGQDPTQQA
jgi:hypothetical protein